MNKLVTIDVDGVLAEFEPKLVRVLASEFGEVAKKNWDTFSLEERYQNHPEVLKRAQLYVNTPSFYKNLEPNLQMIEFVEELTDLGFGVMFLSSRPKTHEEVTRRWLEKNISGYKDYLGLFVGIDNKADWLKDVKPDFFIDDNPDEIERCKKAGIIGLCYEQTWNLGCFPRIVHDRNGEVYLQLSDSEEPFHLINSYKLQEA